MPMTRARLRTPTHDVWQYAPNYSLVPEWVEACTETSDDGLILVRQSGKQLIDHNDWLVRDPDGEPQWLTNWEFQVQYELVKDTP
jgi:hypothetical protein